MHRRSLKRAVWGASAGLVLTWAGQAAAADRTHDGFYLRLGGGFGFVSDRFESEALPLAGDIDGTITGSAVTGELALGGAVTPGWILGVGIYTHTVPNPTADDVSVGTVSTEEVEFDEGSFTLVGPFVDHYFDPRKGFHLQGSLGFGLFALGEGELDDEPIGEGGEQTATGFALMVGLGYEWWVSGGWGLGLLGRFAAGWTEGEDDNDVEWSHSVIAPALLFTATMN